VHFWWDWCLDVLLNGIGWFGGVVHPCWHTSKAGSHIQLSGVELGPGGRLYTTHEKTTWYGAKMHFKVTASKR
jgi:hypothetical protein